MGPAGAGPTHTPLTECRAASVARGQRASPSRPARAGPAPERVPAAGESARRGTCRQALCAGRAPGARRCVGGARAALAEGVRQGKRLPSTPGHRPPAEGPLRQLCRSADVQATPDQAGPPGTVPEGGPEPGRKARRAAICTEHTQTGACAVPQQLRTIRQLRADLEEQGGPRDRPDPARTGREARGPLGSRQVRPGAGPSGDPPVCRGGAVRECSTLPTLPPSHRPVLASPRPLQARPGAAAGSAAADTSAPELGGRGARSASGARVT